MLKQNPILPTLPLSCLHKTAIMTPMKVMLASAVGSFLILVAFASSPDFDLLSGVHLSLTPQAQSSQVAATWAGPLVPCGNTGQEACQACHLVQLGQNLMQFFIFASMLLAAVMFAVAGFFYVTSAGDEHKVETAHTIFKNVFLGLVIVLTAWLLVDTLMKAIFNEGKFGPWNRVEGTCGSASRLPAPFSGTGTPSAAAPSVTAAPAPPPPSGIVRNLDGVFASALLKDNGISVTSSGSCSDQNNPDCTSLEGIRSSTINHVVELKKTCNCELVVTGGTEAGHTAGDTSHANGYKIDLRPTASLNEYLSTKFGFTTKYDIPSNFSRDDPAGNKYTFEGDHWDVTVKSI